MVSGWNENRVQLESRWARQCVFGAGRRRRADTAHVVRGGRYRGGCRAGRRAYSFQKRAGASRLGPLRSRYSRGAGACASRTTRAGISRRDIRLTENPLSLRAEFSTGQDAAITGRGHGPLCHEPRWTSMRWVENSYDGLDYWPDWGPDGKSIFSFRIGTAARMFIGFHRPADPRSNSPTSRDAR